MSDHKNDALAGKVICLGVTGSIACYKAAELTSELRKLGAEIYVVMTDSAQKFVSELTFSTLSRNPVSTSLWEEGQSWQPGHIELADQADLFLLHQLLQIRSRILPMVIARIYCPRFIWQPQHLYCLHQL